MNCARSSAGQSNGFLNRRSQVRVLPGAITRIRQALHMRLGGCASRHAGRGISPRVSRRRFDDHEHSTSKTVARLLPPGVDLCHGAAVGRVSNEAQRTMAGRPRPAGHKHDPVDAVQSVARPDAGAKGIPSRSARRPLRDRRRGLDRLRFSRRRSSCSTACSSCRATSSRRVAI